MKKYIISAVLVFGILAVPASTLAADLTSSQISAIIGLLQAFGADQATINNVQVALNGGTPTNSTQSWCHTFNTNLGVGSKGSEVASLKRILQTEGVLSSSAGEYGLSYDESTGATYDEPIAAAVVQFQAKYSISQTGYVGPLTRAKLNALCGCNVNAISTPTTSVTTVNTSNWKTYNATFNGNISIQYPQGFKVQQRSIMSGSSEGNENIPLYIDLFDDQNNNNIPDCGEKRINFTATPQSSRLPSQNQSMSYHKSSQIVFLGNTRDTYYSTGQASEFNCNPLIPSMAVYTDLWGGNYYILTVYAPSSELDAFFKQVVAGVTATKG